MAFVRRGRFVARILLWTAGLLVLLVVLFVGVLETNAGRSALLGAALRAVEARTGFAARAEGLEVGLLRRQVRLRGFTLAPPGSDPLLRVADLRLSWPLLPVGRGIVPEAVAVEGVRLDLERRPDGSWNLPHLRGSPSRSAVLTWPLRISLRDAALTLRDPARGIRAELGAIDLEAAGTRTETQGTLEIREPLRWRVGGRAGEVTLARAAFRLGRSFILEPWEAQAREGALRLRGALTDLLGTGALAFELDGDFDLARLLAPPDGTAAVEGALHLEGRLAGTIASPAADLTWRAGLTRSAVGPSEIEGRATLAPTAITLEDTSLRLVGGSVHGRGRVVLTGSEQSHIEADGSNLDLLALFTSLGLRLPPAALRGFLEGHLRAAWPQLEWTRPDAEVVLRATPGAPGEGLGIDGRTRFLVRAGRWTLETDTRAGDGARLFGQLDGAWGTPDVMTTTLAGHLDLALDALAGLGPPLGVRALAGRGHARLEASGTLAAPRVEVELEGIGVTAAQAPPADLHAHAVLLPTGVEVDTLGLHAGSAHVQASGGVRFRDGALDAHCEADLPDLAVLSAALPPGFEPAGALHGEGRIEGTWAAPRVTLSATGTDLRLAGQAASSAKLELGLDGRRLRADSVELVQEGGRLSVAGSYDRPGGRFVVAAHGQGFEIGPLPAGVAGPEALRIGGRIDVDFEGRGPGSESRGSGRLRVAGARWEERSLGPITVDLALQPAALRAEIAAPTLALTGEARIGFAAPHEFTATARLDGADVAAWTLAAGQKEPIASGRVSMTARAAGSLPDLLASAVSAEVEPFDARLRGMPLRLQNRARAALAPGEWRVDGLDLSLGETGRLHVDGGLDARGLTSLRGSFEGRLAECAKLAGLTEAGPEGGIARPALDGSAEIAFVVSGSPARPLLAGDARLSDGVLRFSKPGVPPVEGVNARASVRSGELRLEQAEAAWSGARLTASGQAPLSFLDEVLPAPWTKSTQASGQVASLRARMEGDAGQALAPLVPGTVESLGGNAVVTADLHASAPRLEAVQGEVRLEGADFRLNRVALRQSGPAVLHVESGRLSIDEAAWKGSLTELRLAARAQAGPRGDPLGGAMIEATLTGGVDLQLLQGLGRGFESGGTGSMRLHATGPLGSLRTDGEIRLNAGTVRHRPTRFALDGLSGSLRWNGAGIEVEDVKGSLNGGPFQATGALRKNASGRGYEGAIRLQARSAFLEWPRGLSARLRTNLALEPSGDGLRLAGSLRIFDGAYRTRDYFSLQVLDLVERFSRESSPSRFDPLKLDVAVTSAGDVLLDAVDGRLLVGVDLKLGGSVGAPEMGGRLVAAPGGQVFMAGRTYDLDSAVLDFSRGAGFEPYVQAQARTRVSDYSVLADVTGPATRAVTQLTSTPPLGQRDVVALLTSGRTVGAGGGGTQTDALSMASGGVLGRTGEKLGLDSLRIESAAGWQELDFDPTLVGSEASPASRLTFSKRLATNLSATFSRSLTQAAYTWFVAWKPRPSVELRFVQHDDQTGALEFRHDVTIGEGGPPVPPPRRRRRRSGETVSEVRLTGDDGAARRSHLGLRQGQPFDYDRWLADRDRLEEDLAREGYAEARVLASRETPGSGNAAPGPAGDAPRRREVALVYDVHRGPRTELVLRGIPSPSALRARIERAWREADYATSIDEEATTLARADLYERGFLRARVTSRLSVAPDGETKTLTVEAEPGEAVGSRRIVFEGNARVPTARLEGLVRDPRRAAAAWLRPPDLRDAVVELYRREGLLAARVEVPRPAFRGKEARLVVSIDEGPVVPIAEVSVQGAERLGPQAVLAAARLTEGRPFRPADVDAARARIEAAYRRAGFTEATARVNGRLDASSGTMKIDIDVAEGAREVLQEVAVLGGSAKTRARARRELRLTPGEPVVLEEWTQARRRIYETGLFRRVDVEPTSQSSSPPDTEAGPPEGDREVRATFKLEEWPDLRLRYGLQLVTTNALASEAGPQSVQLGGVVEATRQTLFDRAASTGLSVQARKDEQEARAFLSLPRTLGTPVRSSLVFTMRLGSSAREEVGRNILADRREELTWEERWRAARRLDVAGAYKFQWARFDTPRAVPGLVPSARLSRLVGTVLFDARNDLVDTSKGSFSSASYEWGGEAVGSDYPLRRLFLQEFAYLPLPGGLVLGGAARAESAAGVGAALLVDDRLQAGGANTVRGFGQDALEVSPAIVNLLEGSTRLVVWNAELRFPIRGAVRGVLFGDGATLRADFGGTTTHDSIWSTGLGLRYVTPVGILRLDYGIPLDRGFKPRRGRVYFSLGQLF